MYEGIWHEEHVLADKLGISVSDLSKPSFSGDLGQFPMLKCKGAAMTIEEGCRVHKLWSSWCIEPHTFKEIRLQIINHPEIICYTYLCENSQIDPNYLEEFMCLSTGCLTADYIFDPNDFDYKAVKAILRHKYSYDKKPLSDRYKNWSKTISLPEYEIKNQKYVKQYRTRTVTPDTLCDTLDWDAILRNSYVPASFKKKYPKLFVRKYQENN